MKGKSLAEIRVEISKTASQSMVTFQRNPETNQIVILLRLRPVTPVEEFLHEAIHVAQVAKALEARKSLTFDLAVRMEREVAR